MEVDFLLFIIEELCRSLLLFVSYIKNGKVFPEPLSKEEEKKCLEKMADGDKKARDKLIEHNLRLVAHIVKKYDSKYTDREDLISIGTIGLIKGINTFNQDKKTRLATYAARCIENEILMHLRASKKLNQEVLLQETIGSDKEGNQISLIDILKVDGDSVLEQVSDKINQEKLYKKINELPTRQQKVLKYRYGLEASKRLTQREVADILGISRSYVSRIEKKAVSNLSKIFI